MEALRTPDERFANLPGYNFEAKYVEVPSGDGGSLRMHYVDEGSGPTVLLLHGEPSWSFLYRKMIPIITAAGYRAVAPDLIGFGRSDKPTEKSDYTYQRHVDWVWSLIEQLDLKDMYYFGQDWGALIGLRIVGEHPERFANVAIGNGFLPTGDQNPGEAFLRWQQFSQNAPAFDIGRIIQGGTATELPDDVVAAYDAPFPDDSYKAGARIFPSLVPTSPDDPASERNRAAWKTLQQFEKPFLTAFGDSDPITKGGDRFLQAAIPGTQDQPHTTIVNAGHFLQEDQGEDLAKVLVDWWKGL
jgi:haloalkane dehalogenase